MTHLESIQNKIIQNEDSLNCLLSYWRFKNQKIVFSNGCFDILHLGHVEYLSKAADLGDILFVGLNTDKSVKKLKGSDRPIQDEISRLTILASLSFVSAIMLFDEETPYELIKKVQPDILVKGSDYKPEEIVGYDIVIQSGGRVETISLVEGHSTTNIIMKMTK